MTYFMRIVDLLEKISIPRHVSTKIYDIITTFCKSHPTSQYIQFGSSLGDELFKFVSTEMPGIGLKGVNIFASEVPSGAHALVNKGIIEFGPSFLNNLNHLTNLQFRKRFAEVFIHELTHIIQASNGAFAHSKNLESSMLSRSTSLWFNRKKDGVGSEIYDFHSMSTTELQAIGVQLANHAFHSSNLVGKFAYHDFINAMLDTYYGDNETVADRLQLKRLDGKKFSIDDVKEKKAIKTMYRAFLNALHDFYYGEGHDDDMQQKYAADKEKGELKRLSKNRNRIILSNLRRIERTFFKDQFPSWARFRRFFKNSEEIAESDFFYTLKSVIPCSVGDELDVINGEIQLDLPKLNKIMHGYDRDEPAKEVYEKVMQEIYNQIKQKSSEITIWEKR